MVYTKMFQRFKGYFPVSREDRLLDSDMTPPADPGNNPGYLWTGSCGHQPSTGSMPGQRQRRWSSIEIALDFDPGMSKEEYILGQIDQ